MTLMLPPREARPDAVLRPDGTPVRVLVVDDEPSLSDVVTRGLRYEGWDVTCAADGETAVALARDVRPDAVVLDIMLPDIDGFEVLRRMRDHTPDLPVLFLTARDSLEDRVAGLAVGDDYVTKPFSLDELIARLRALVVRTGAGLRPTAVPVLTVGDLVLDEDVQEIRRAGEVIDLTATEYKVLRHLMHSPGRVLGYAEILFCVWNHDFGGQSAIVDMYVSSLRRKLDRGGQPMIRTVPGSGYLLEP